MSGEQRSRREPGAAGARRGLYGGATVVLSSLVALLGVAMIVIALAGGGGPLARGVLVGLLFVLAGGGRAWMAWRGASIAAPPEEEGGRRG